MHIKVTVCISDQLQSVGSCSFFKARENYLKIFIQINTKSWSGLILFLANVLNVIPLREKEGLFYLLFSEWQIG